MEATIEDLRSARIEEMVDYIMKHCLWQFHSRAWDRKRQNEGILGQAAQILCGESPRLDTPEERCYWVDAVCLAEAYRERLPWLSSLGVEEMRDLMAGLRERMDYLTITGSLNLELTDQHY